MIDPFPISIRGALFEAVSHRLPCGDSECFYGFSYRCSGGGNEIVCYSSLSYCLLAFILFYKVLPDSLALVAESPAAGDFTPIL
jgi:hypothetical protein